jgi:hypothetical protein
MKKMIVSGLAAAAASIGIAAFPVATAHAEGCAAGGGGPGFGGYCDSDYWPDGSYMHCVKVYVLGFGGEQCNRVRP